MADQDRNDDVILIEREPPIGWLIFNRPEKLNAFNQAMWAAVPEKMAELEADPEIRVIIIRGAGERAFAAGADISEFGNVRSDPTSASSYSQSNQAAYAALRESPKPTIGMIHGFCIGGGCALALNIDIRVASDEARFALTPARLGLGYSYSGIEHAITEIGAPATRYLFLTASHAGAAEAQRIGVVHEVFPAAELEAETRKLALKMAENAPMTMRAVKSCVRAIQDGGAGADRLAAVAEVDACFKSEDYREGVRAFGEKRKPRFMGK